MISVSTTWDNKEILLALESDVGELLGDACRIRLSTEDALDLASRLQQYVQDIESRE